MDITTILTLQDIPQVLSLHREFVELEKTHESKDLQLQESHLLKYNNEIIKFFKTYINNPCRKCYVYKKDRKIVGFILGQINTPLNSFFQMKKVGEVQMVYLNEKCRGKGRGDKLMFKLERWFCENECKLSVVKYFEDNPHASFYHKLNYKEIEITARKNLNN